MPFVQLHPKRYQTYSIGTHVLHLEQILAWMRIAVPGRTAVLVEGVLDTGAPMTVFIQAHWRRFLPAITWLTAQNDPNVPSWCKQFSGVAGGRISCRLGKVDVQFFDHVGGRVGPSPIVAMFAYDNGQMRDTLVGLGGGPFTKRRLEMVYDTQTTVLSDI